MWFSQINQGRPLENESLSCEHCEKTSAYKSGTTRHVNQKHLKEKNHISGRCGKQLSIKEDWTTHMRTCKDRTANGHRACKEMFIGERCAKTFTYKDVMIKHVKQVRDMSKFTHLFCYSVLKLLIVIYLKVALLELLHIYWISRSWIMDKVNLKHFVRRKSIIIIFKHNCDWLSLDCLLLDFTLLTGAVMLRHRPLH